MVVSVDSIRMDLGTQVLTVGVIGRRWRVVAVVSCRGYEYGRFDFVTVVVVVVGSGSGRADGDEVV